MSGTGITVQPGWEVYGIDGSKIGTVREVDSSYFRLRTGGILAKDLFVPMSAIEDLDEPRTRVNLNVDKSDSGRMGWDRPPEESSVTSGSVASRAGLRDADMGQSAAGSRGPDLRYPAGVGADAVSRIDVERDDARSGMHDEDDGRLGA